MPPNCEGIEGKFYGPDPVLSILTQVLFSFSHTWFFELRREIHIDGRRRAGANQPPFVGSHAWVQPHIHPENLADSSHTFSYSTLSEGGETRRADLSRSRDSSTCLSIAPPMLLLGVRTKSTPALFSASLSLSS